MGIQTNGIANFTSSVLKPSIVKAIECPKGHFDTYKVIEHELKSFWKKGWIQNGVYLIGCNVCEDFYQIDRYEYYININKGE